ncbi:MAG: thioredoxin family protein [Bacteroides sp.]|nr:thioredoxin family protein [Bacteroidales bacterium]MBD5291867.1 thioredoxin family protein [Bacteroides sp.]MBD5337520.1 thioredoxin family protein [Bacteroides sp.]MBD5339840.1 thioredoxin family protein [Bacteroides sp.]
MKTFESRVNEGIPSIAVFMHAGSQDATEIKRLADELRAKYGERINIMRVDASFDHRLKKQYDIKAYPTWILFKKGEELMRETGHKTFTQLSDMVERAF